jgi:hypothetical protein
VYSSIVQMYFSIVQMYFSIVQMYFLYIKRVRIVSFFAENCFPTLRHCEERSDEAIQKVVDFWIASSLRSSQ